MTGDSDELIGRVLNRLNERAKELNCIYSVVELLHDRMRDQEEVFISLLDVIPAGWQFPAVCEVRILFEGKDYRRPDFVETNWVQCAEIIIDNNISGKIQVYYTQLIRERNGSQFLPEEQQLLNTIARHVSNFIFSQRLRKTLTYLNTHTTESAKDEELGELLPTDADEHWKWRRRMAQMIADRLDFVRFGVVAVYLSGSTRNGSAGPGSDIDLIIHVRGDSQQHRELMAWLEGWGLALAEMNFCKTGFKTECCFIDLHLVTDEEIANGSSNAVMIGKPCDGAHLLRDK
jgi:predicted nucleotidyltransferase